jgi:hypothetical protein
VDKVPGRRLQAAVVPPQPAFCGGGVAPFAAELYIALPQKR